jgi:hypothetical protein
MSEATVFARLAEQLSTELSEVPAEEITVAVRAEQERFLNSPVREFIPVLVERSVRRRFRAEVPTA